MIKKVIQKELFWIISLFFFVLIVYLLFLPKCHMQLGYGQDANENSWWLERGLYFRRLKDVLYPFLACWFYKIWKILGWQKGGMHPLQVLSSIFGAMGTIVFYFLIKTISRDRKISLATSIFFAFSNAYWFFSIESVNNILCLFFLLMSMLVLLRAPEDDIIKFPVFIALLHSTAIFMEVLGFLLVPAMAFAIYLFTNNKKQACVRILMYLGVLCLVTACVHFLIGYRYLGPGNLKGLVGSLTYGSPMEIVIHRRLWLTLHALLQTLLVWPNEELMRSDLYNVLTKANLTVLLVFFAGILYALFHIRRFSNYFTKVIVFAAFWIIIPLPFYSWNEPTALEYYLYLLPAIWLVIVVLFVDIRQRISRPRFKNISNYSALAILPMFIIYNFAMGVYPRSKIGNNEVYKEYMFLKRYINDKELLIIFEGRGSPGLAICYLNKIAGKIVDNIIYVDCDEGPKAHHREAWIRKVKPDYPVYYEELLIERGEDEEYYGPSFYKWLVDKSQSFDNIKICVPHTSPQSLLKYGGKLNVSNIVLDIAKTSEGRFKENKHTQKFLEDLSVNYGFELINTDFTLLALSRKKRD